MTALKPAPKRRRRPDPEEFVAGAENDRSRVATPADEPLPWTDPRDDVIKTYNLRLPEPYLLKLRFIAKHTPDSMQTFCAKSLLPAIDAEIRRLTE